MFCERCGGLMKPKDGVLTCDKCQVTKKLKEEDKQTIVAHREQKEIALIDSAATLPIDRQVLCEKCGNTQAYYVIRQMRAADEAETMIYQCTKCGYKWRRYG